MRQFAVTCGWHRNERSLNGSVRACLPGSLVACGAERNTAMETRVGG
jgi:hypothetical protein